MEASNFTSEEAQPSSVIYHFRDINALMVKSWTEKFSECIDACKVTVSCGDIFVGAPAADALVSPANSFGYMDGGIDQIYINHFGWQMQTRLQKVIKKEYNGEILVGQAAIIPTFPVDTPSEQTSFPDCNQNKPIKYLISAPTMRVPHVVNQTVNSFLAFRATILAVKRHNDSVKEDCDKIKSVLCPGLGTAVGKMEPFKCAYQMREAFDIYEEEKCSELRNPKNLQIVWNHHDEMVAVKQSDESSSGYLQSIVSHLR